MKKLSGRRYQCPTCGEYFNSSAAFDKHRTGDWEARACLTPSQMENASMALNTAGFWVTAKFTGTWAAKS